MKTVWIVIVFMLLGGCSKGLEVNTREEKPDDFDFSLKYGVHGKREINTFHNFVVKDLVSDGTIQATLVLTEQEMNDIYNEMTNLNIMGELDLEKEKGCSVSPSSNSVWEIHMNNETKKFSYQSYCEPPKVVQKLYQLENFIHEIVLEREEYKKLPNVIDGYK